MKNLPIIGIVVILIVAGAGVFIYFNLTKQVEAPKVEIMPKTLEGKKIAMVVSFRDFRDVEYFIPKDVLREAGAQITTISSEKGTAIGADGGEVRVDLAAPEAQVENFDAVVFIGGPGMGQNLSNEEFQKIAKDAAATGKILGAICIAPALLAKAGVLSGKKATVWSSPLDKSAIKMLKEGRAEYISEDVVIDGKIVTAAGPDVVKKFTEKLIELLK
jgi:protease I